MKTDPMHGLLLVRKPPGMTSHDVVYKVRRLLGQKEVGHAGTLDPMAEGLMVILLGEATKMSAYVLEENKQYLVRLRLGFETDTLDSTGTVLREFPVTVTEAQVEQVGCGLSGEFQWEIPLFSAKKVGGEKLYEQARRGEAPAILPTKVMKFWGVEYLGRVDERDFRFRLHCSKGSFIRSWVQQLGRKLGCGAMMTGLERLYSAPYHVDQALILDSVTGPSEVQNSPSFIPFLKMLPEVKTLRVKGQSEGMMRNGQISHELKRRLIVFFNPETDSLMKIMSHRPEQLLAMVGFEPGRGFVVRRVFRS